MRNHRALALLLALVATLTACAPAPGARPTSADEAPRASGPKRIIAAISTGDPVMLRSSAWGISGGGATPGIDIVEDLLHAGATRRDDTDTLRPLLAEALPSAENGLWKVFPDGRMETTWTLKDGARWQDGTPFTSQDLLFTLAVCLDKDMIAIAFSQDVGIDFIDSASATDDRSITVTWKQPFIEADALFTTQFAMPLPKHLLESTFRENKRGLTDLPYWNHEFIGAGPFQIRDWVDGSHIVLAAYPGYILGRPKIDEVVVKFIPDLNTIVANMLAGEIDVSLGRGLTLEQAIQIRDHWPEARLEVGWPNWVVAYPQFIDPRPVALLDVRFRKGLVHAIDRQEMADTLQGGLAPVAHAYFNTSLPKYRELDPFVVKYEFDPRKAVQLIESTGYVRGADGSFRPDSSGHPDLSGRDPAGERLSLEIRNAGGLEIQNKSMFSVADYWQRIGIPVETIVIPQQRLTDREYRATRPGFELAQNPDGMKGLRRAHGSQTPLPENNFGRSGNVSRYLNPEFDAMLDRFFSTIPIRERMQALGQILNHTTDQVTAIGFFNTAVPTVASSRLLGVGPRMAQEGTEAWNVHQWDVR